jgi:hypothetical protein
MLRPKTPNGAARRMKRMRARRDAGLRVYSITADPAAVEDLLIEFGWIGPNGANDHDDLERGIEAMFTQYADVTRNAAPRRKVR